MPTRAGHPALTRGLTKLDPLWQHIKWHDHDWNRDPTVTPRASEHRWYHYDDITQAIEDGGLDRITDEHTRYVKETDRERDVNNAAYNALRQELEKYAGKTILIATDNA